MFKKKEPKVKAHNLIQMYMPIFPYLVAKDLAIKSIGKTISVLIDHKKDIILINYWSTVYYHLLTHNETIDDNTTT